MTIDASFTPMHISASHKDLEGNDGFGRYVLLPGSDGRAQQLAKELQNHKTIVHPRGHHVYLGTLPHSGASIDVAVVSSGMGCPSMEIILHELFHLGAKRFLRVGTTGSLQPKRIGIAHLINAMASVRDEMTTLSYAPRCVPALASLEVMQALARAAKQLQLDNILHTGSVHCKDSFYAREFGAGPLGAQNLAYMATLEQCGVLATEMETATLFMQAQIYDQMLRTLGGDAKQHRVFAGALLGVVAIPPDRFATEAENKQTVEKMTALAMATLKELADFDRA